MDRGGQTVARPPVPVRLGEFARRPVVRVAQVADAFVGRQAPIETVFREGGRSVQVVGEQVADHLEPDVEYGAQGADGYRDRLPDHRTGGEERHVRIGATETDGLQATESSEEMEGDGDGSAKPDGGTAHRKLQIGREVVEQVVAGAELGDRSTVHFGGSESGETFVRAMFPTGLSDLPQICDNVPQCLVSVGECLFFISMDRKRRKIKVSYGQ